MGTATSDVFISYSTNAKPWADRLSESLEQKGVSTWTDFKSIRPVIVADEQEHLQYLTMEDAVTHCTKGIGIWNWAAINNGEEPDAVMACASDIPTMESLAAVAILKDRFPDLKIRFVNVVDLFRLMPETEHPPGLPTGTSILCLPPTNR